LSRSGLACALVATTLSCEAVPNLHFEPADGGADTRLAVDSGRDDGGRDSGSRGDSGLRLDGASEETEPPIGCPDEPPDGAVCCDKTPCIGDCGDAGCQSCVAKCGGELCCAKNATNPMCVTLSKGCH
jgi:hypothetical protein